MINDIISDMLICICNVNLVKYEIVGILNIKIN